MACGIYAIKNKMNGKMYIGKTTNSKNRFIRHKYLLKCGKHFNPHLQKSYNKNGIAAFDFIVLEECAEDCLPDKEQEWIDKHLGFLYNSEIFVKDKKGCKNPFAGKRHTDETKIKMRAAKIGKYNGGNNPNFGTKQSLDTRLKMAKNNSRTKLISDDVLKIKKLLLDGIDHQTIANQFNISRTVVTRISNGTRWANITGGPVIPVVYIDGIRQFSDNHKNKIGNKRKGQKHTETAKEKIRQARKGMQICQD